MHTTIHGLLLKLSKYWLVLLVALVAFVGFTIRAGYKLPQTDIHPDWPEFPRLKTKHLVVERIANFDSLYGRRYRLSAAVRFGIPDAPDSLPGKAVRVLGHRVFENRFKFTQAAISNNAGMAVGPSAGQGFSQYGVEYWEIDLAGEKGYFKETYASYFPPRYFFHPYNQPTSRRDTLFLRFVSDDYRIFVR